MNRLKFGAFLAPHHPLGEHPMPQFQRDLDFAAHLDRLGYEEFWCGEHHSSGSVTLVIFGSNACADQARHGDCPALTW